MTYSLPTAVSLRSFKSARTYSSFSQTLTVPVGSTPAGALVVCAVFAGPFRQDGAGNLSNTLGVPRFFNGINQGNMSYVQSDGLSGVGETVSQSQFYLAYRFMPANGLQNDPNFAVQVDCFPGPGMNQVADIQVGVYDGVDSSGTLLTAHNDFQSTALPQVFAGVASVLLGVWCSQDMGTYVTSSYGTLANGSFGTSEADGNIPFQMSGNSIIIDVPAGTTPALVAQQTAAFTGTDPSALLRLRNAILVMPIKKVDAVGDLSTEGY